MVDSYLKLNSGSMVKNINYTVPENAAGNENIRIKKVSVAPQDITIDKEITLDFEFWNMQEEKELKIAFDLLNMHEQIVFGSGADIVVNKGNIGKTTCCIPANLLNDDAYSIHLFFFTEGMRPLFQQREIVSFEVKDVLRNYAYFGKVNGVVRPVLNWAVHKI
jgi:lipopolysaccharide transport system ATP-binding protein